VIWRVVASYLMLLLLEKLPENGLFYVSLHAGRRPRLQVTLLLEDLITS
jgi:hypothetical protein